MSSIFSPVALFITFREAAEAGIIVSVLLALLKKTKQEHLVKYVWRGAVVGFVAALAVGIVFMVAFYQFKQALYEGKSEQKFEGSVMLVACLMTTVVAFSMLRLVSMHEKWTARFEASVGVAGAAAASEDESPAIAAGPTVANRAANNAVFMACFTAVAREGVEAVIFITGVSQADPRSLPLPGVIGLLLGSLFATALYHASRPVPVKPFVIVMAFVLFAIGAGLLSRSMHEFAETGAFGTYPEDEEAEEAGSTEAAATTTGGEGPLPLGGGGAHPTEAPPRGAAPRPSWGNTHIADFRGCCDSDKDKSSFYALMRALFGYQARPTRLEVLFYAAYWAAVLLWVCAKLARGTLYATRRRDVVAAPVVSVKEVDDAEEAVVVVGEEGARDEPPVELVKGTATEVAWRSE